MKKTFALLASALMFTSVAQAALNSYTGLFKGSGGGGLLTNLVAGTVSTAGPLITTNPVTGKLVPTYNGNSLTNLNLAANGITNATIPNGLVTNNTAGAVNIATNSTLTSSNIVATGTFTGNGSGLTNLNGGQLVGNVLNTTNGRVGINAIAGVLSSAEIDAASTVDGSMALKVVNSQVVNGVAYGILSVSSGAGTYQNRAIFASASGAPVNYDFYGFAGTLYNESDGIFGGTVTASGFAAGASNGISAIIPVSGTNWIFTAGLLTGHTP